jgi:Rrf2 family protein
MKLSQTVAYAVHAVLRLADSPDGACVSCKKIAEQGNMPERFLLQIVHSLGKQGILLSTRGGSGGFRLARSPDEISLLEVIEAVEGPIAAALPLNDDLPKQVRERLLDTLRSVTEERRRQLEAVKFSDLLNVETAKKPMPKKKGKGP